MRKSLIILAITVMTAVSCVSEKSIPQQLDNFANKTEAQAPSYSTEDWDAVQQEYEQLIDAFTSNFDSFTTDEKKEALEAIGKYHAVLIKNGLNETAAVLSMIKETLPNYLNGLLGIVKDNEGSIIDNLSKILDMSELEKTVDNIGNELGGIFKAIADSLDIK